MKEIDFDKICDECVNNADPEEFTKRESPDKNVFIVSNVECFCKDKQKNDTCKSFSLFKEWLEKKRKGKEKSDIQFCLRCCDSKGVEVFTDFMSNAMLPKDKKSFYCPSLREKFADIEARDEKCDMKVLKVMEGLEVSVSPKEETS